MLRRWPAVMLAAVLLVGLGACQQGEKGPSARARAAERAAERAKKRPTAADSKKAEKADPTPPPARKPLTQLKFPPGMEDKVEDVLMLQSAWPSQADLRIGDWVEYETALTDKQPTRLRREVFDVAEGGFVEVIDTIAPDGDKEKKTRSVRRNLYFARRRPAPANPPVAETRAADRNLKVGEQEVKADWEVVVTANGKTLSKSWYARQVPLAGRVEADGADAVEVAKNPDAKRPPLGGLVLTEDGEGKPRIRLVGFGRGK